MSVNNKIAESKTQKRRPHGVWVLTIYALIFAGSDLLLSDSFLVLKGEVAMFRSDAVAGMLLWAYLNIGIIIASVLAWAGWEPGRILFLSLICIVSLDQGMGQYLWITHRDFGKAPTGSQIIAWFHFIRGVLIPILYIWYFNRHSTKEFFMKM